MAYDLSPVTAIIEALNLEKSETSEDDGRIVFHTQLLGVDDIICYRERENRVFIRILNLIARNLEVDSEENKKLRICIHQWCLRFEEGPSATDQGMKFREIFRRNLNDDQATISIMTSHKPGRKSKTNGRFIAIEIIPYILRYLDILTPPQPELEPIWNLIRAIKPFPDWPFSSENPRNALGHPRKRPLLHEKVPVPSYLLPPRPDLEEALRIEKTRNLNVTAEFRKNDPKLREAQVKIELLTEQLTKVQAEKELLWQEHCLTTREKCTPALRGRIAEDTMMSIFAENLSPHCKIGKVSHLTNHGDIMIIYRHESSRILGYAIVDIKDYSGTVGSSQVMKLEKDIDACTLQYGVRPLWTAIISLHSGIANRGETRARSYRYKSVPIFLIHDLLLHEGDDGTDEVRKLLSAGDFIFWANLERRDIAVESEEALKIDKITALETNPSWKIIIKPSGGAGSRRSASNRSKRVFRHVIFEPSTLPIVEPTPVTSIGAVIPTPVPDPTPDSDTDQEADIAAFEIPIVSSLRDNEIDMRLFKNPAHMTKIAYDKVVILNRVICYKEGSKIPTAEITKRLAPMWEQTVKSARRTLHDLCHCHVTSCRWLPNAEFR